jgi:hypothetical protein
MNIGETIALIKAFGNGGGGGLPGVTSADNGKVLGVVDGAWAASEQGKKFIVTLTPTAQDYSGTMGKTVSEINAAYEAGREIWFRMVFPAGAYVEVPLNRVVFDTEATYRTFMASIVDADMDAVICIFTISDNGTNNQYATKLYPLTPAS